MRFQHVLLGFVGVGLSIRCTPDFGSLQEGAAGGGGGKRNDGGAGGGGEITDAGTSGTAGSTFGGGPSNVGGAGGEGGMAGEAGSAGAGQGGGGAGQGGAGGFGGEGGDAAGAGGTGSEPPLVIPCEDGCAHLYVPFSKDKEYRTQFFTIELGANRDLTGAVITARVRVVGLARASETAQLYCSDAEYAYFGGALTALSSLASEEGGTLTLSPVTGPDPNGDTFDAPKVRTFGIQIATTSADPQPVNVIVEDFVITGSSAPLGPWAFTDNAEAIVPNTYLPVEGSDVFWAPPYP